MSTRVRGSGIGDAARRAGLAPHVLRHWEEIGLLAPARDASGRRRYADGDHDRIAAILVAKEAGMRLDSVRAYLAGDRGRRRALLTEHLTDLEARIAALRGQAGTASRALAVVAASDPDACARTGPESLRDPHVNSIDSADSRSSSARLTGRPPA